ncbi:MAG: SMP-30/gluconolactonase/LRE family protein [Leptospiraceae bacterium]|nr:SMP-30/gluconolactonase/LRE family protein [Leptospiraceae bacterium]
MQVRTAAGVTVKSALAFLLYALSFCSPISVNLTPDRILAKASYPEGPLVVGEYIYFVEYAKNAIKRVSLDPAVTAAQAWEYVRPGCGPSGLAQLPDGSLLVACYDENSLLQLRPKAEAEKSEILRVLSSALESGVERALHGPNDLAVRLSDSRVFFTASGAFDREAPSVGKLYQFGLSGPEVIAEGLHYANGVAVSPDGQRLYVGEHLSRRILFAALDQPRITLREFVNLEDEAVRRLLPRPGHNEPAEQAYIGPDGMAVAPDGYLFVAIFGGGTILVFDPKGSPVAAFSLEFLDVTNLDLACQEGHWKSCKMYVTEVGDAWRAPYSGRVVMYDLARLL